MDRRKQIILGGSALVVVFAAALGLGFTQQDEGPTKNKVELAAVDKAGQQACASAAAYDQLKGTIFADAIKVRSTDPENLNTLAEHSVVRMEEPVFKGRHPSLGTISCSGTFILELPPGAESAFGGQRRLTADIDYTAQRAADGSGLVYQINGAERIMAQLADFNLQGRSFAPPLEADTEFAEVQPGWLPMGMGGPEEPVPAEQAEDAADIDRAEAAARAQRRERVMRAAQEASEERRRAQAEARAERNRERRTERSRRAEASPSRSSSRPSFNCRYAKTRSEKMVCESDRLAARDRQMAAMFYGAMDEADRGTRRELNRTRDRFLAYRDRCRSEDCVAQAYEGRMREIDDIMAASD
jgi:hypothetical protein